MGMHAHRQENMVQVKRRSSPFLSRIPLTYSLELTLLAHLLSHRNINMALPRYETKIVTLPVITQTHRRSLPNRLGPWPLKRTRSEADWNDVPLGETSDELSGKLNLKTVLTRLDEECAAIDKVLLRDSDGNTSNGACTMQSDDQTHVAKGRHMVDKVACNVLGTLLVFATTMAFVGTPLMTFIFANKDWGKILINENAPSKTTFAFILSIPVVSVGFSLTVAAVTALALRNGWTFLRRRRNAMIVVFSALLAGLFLDLWVLVWLLPLVDHGGLQAEAFVDAYAQAH